MKGKILTLFFVIAATTLSYAQGTLRGVVKNKDTQEPIALAKLKFKLNGQNRGAECDFDGEYQVKLPAGTHMITFSMQNEGYIDEEIEVTITNGEVQVLNVELSKSGDVKELGPIVVEVVRTKIGKTLEDDDKRRMNESGATDGMSDEQMKERGVNTVVDAAQAVPGVTIEDGKSVYVRGLGDRYTKTILNGMEIPGLDPDRNSVQLDIFPTAVVDNITIYKTFLPNWSGDYSGGLVNIITKDLPAERYIYAKAGLGYNNFATFNSNYVTYDGGALDFLGFDDGTRKLPINERAEISNPVVDDPTLELQTKSFNRTMSASRAAQFMNQTYAFGMGNRKVFRDSLAPKDRITYGYNVVVNYRNTHNFFEGVEYGEYRLFPNLGQEINQLERNRVSVGDQSQHNVLWTALVSQSAKYRRSKLDLTLFHTQNAISSAAFFNEEEFEDNPITVERTNLEYTQRSVSNANLGGRHFLDSLSRWKLEWKLSPTYSSINDPDIRSTLIAYETDENGNQINYELNGPGGQSSRIWRYLTEYNLGGRFDFSYKFKVDSTRKAEIMFGGLNTYRNRDFKILQYFTKYRNVNNVDFNPNPDWYFEEENIWTVESDQGTYIEGNFEPANNFIGRQNVAGAYVMNQLPITENFEATYGVRVENAKNWYTGQNNAGTDVFNDRLILDEWNVLPSVNMVYKVEKAKDSLNPYDRRMNFRGAYATTVARPSFKEKSLAQIFDPLQGRTFLGNIDLQQTTIHNFDARWEYFFGRTELISFSGFFKQFQDQIEMIAISTAPDNVTPWNTGSAQVFGAEAEIRKAIGFNKVEKQHLSFVLGANYTYVVSRVDMRTSIIPVGDTLIVERDNRVDNAREGEVIGNYRQMYGQSPHIVNAFATFRNDSLGLIFNLNYNVQGKKLAVIGTGRIPDVFEQPFHSLNFKVSKRFGSEREWQASLTGRNLLLAKRQLLYESFNTQPEVYSAWSPGVNVSFSVSYNLSGKKKKPEAPASAQ
ncbi:MAG: carboxypeptidase-like regulatory domain-containing protein [bacterium]|nr:carboxypeptidase-like regulatory domain-containing protein [bacterium]